MRGRLPAAIERYARRVGGWKGAVVLLALAGVLAFLERGGDLAPRDATRTGLCTVSAVRDGDTMLLGCPGVGEVRVRVWGIDAPEMGQVPWGEESRRRMSELAGSAVRMEEVDRDPYGRIVARLYRDQRDIGLELVGAGMAQVYERFNQRDDYHDARAEARQARLGIWSASGLHRTPWVWRSRNPRRD